jgi:hypothetical protein
MGILDNYSEMLKRRQGLGDFRNDMLPGKNTTGMGPGSLGFGDPGRVKPPFDVGQDVIPMRAPMDFSLSDLTQEKYGLAGVGGRPKIQEALHRSNPEPLPDLPEPFEPALGDLKRRPTPDQNARFGMKGPESGILKPSPPSSPPPPGPTMVADAPKVQPPPALVAPKEPPAGILAPTKLADVEPDFARRAPPTELPPPAPAPKLPAPVQMAEKAPLSPKTGVLAGPPPSQAAPPAPAPTRLGSNISPGPAPGPAAPPLLGGTPSVTPLPPVAPATATAPNVQPPGAAEAPGAMGGGSPLTMNLNMPTPAADPGPIAAAAPAADAGGAGAMGGMGGMGDILGGIMGIAGAFGAGKSGPPPPKPPQIAPSNAGPSTDAQIAATRGPSQQIMAGLLADDVKSLIDPRKKKELA